MDDTICMVSAAERRAGDRIEKRDAMHEAARTLLANEFVNAFRAGGSAKVSTPAWNRRSAHVVDVLSDLFAGLSGDAALGEVVSILSAAARGETVTIRAMGWIAARAGEHAEMHADDLADEIGGEA